LASVVSPLPAPLLSKARAVARRLLPLLPIALAVAIVTWWPRPSAPRPGAAVAPAQSPATATSAEADGREDERLAEAIDRTRVSTLALEYNAGDPSGKRRVATGVALDPEGYVISVRVEPPEGRDRESILARDSAGHEHPARFVAADPETGLTLLKVDAGDIRPIRPTARAALLGAAVFLIGHPYNLGPSVSVGNVAGLDRRMTYGPRTLSGLIQLQVSLHPGDSGALLADRGGGWLGLIRGGGVTPDGKDDNSLGFAIPAPEALWVARQLQDKGKVDRAYLGIRLHRDSGEPGAEVAEVLPGSPAEKAGLREKDRIVGLDDRPIRTRDDLTDRLDRIAAGTEVSLEYARGTALARLAVRTASRAVKSSPPPPVDPTPSPKPSPAGP
jgi:serine protease Do